MASKKAPNGGEREMILSAIRKKLRENHGEQIRPHEAILILEWAIECKDRTRRDELLELFDTLGGVKLMRDAFGSVH